MTYLTLSSKFSTISMAAQKSVSKKSRIGQTFLNILVLWLLLDVFVTEAVHHYIGCYNDSSAREANQENRALNLTAYKPNNPAKNETIDTCIKSCADYNYTYAGAQYGYQCFCGDSGYDKYGKADESDCNQTCSGNSSQKCGSANRNSVYSVCPAGNYGQSCKERCNCLNNTICRKSDGECLYTKNRCKSGWKGLSCNLRDCEQNNGDCSDYETCYNITSFSDNITVCRCKEGFQRNNKWGNCTDIDECSTGKCDLSRADCKNSIGGFNCSCKDGYKQLNSSVCQDIDECVNSICDSATTINCSNTIGGFICECRDGFVKYNITVCQDEGNTCLNQSDSYDEDDCEAGIEPCIEGMIIAAGSSASVCVAIAIIVSSVTFICRRKSKYCTRSKNPKRALDNNPKTISKTLDKNLKTKPSTTLVSVYCSETKSATLDSKSKEKSTTLDKNPKTKSTISDKSPKTKAIGKKQGLFSRKFARNKSPETEFSGKEAVIGEITKKCLKMGKASEDSDSSKPSGRGSMVYANAEAFRRNSTTSRTSTYEMPDSNRLPDDDQDVYTDLQHD